MHEEERTLLQGTLTQEQMTKFDEIHQQRSWQKSQQINRFLPAKRTGNCSIFKHGCQYNYVKKDEWTKIHDI